jgi:preprotein translocase subunit SecB
MATSPAPSPQAEESPVFNIEKIYVKDLSCEVPNAPEIFTETEAPALETEIKVEVDNFTEGFYEVALTATVTTKIKEKVMFLVEATQCGIFQMRHIPPADLEPLANIHCANIVFPYLRTAVAHAITEAGFPVLHLPAINFEAYYQARLQQQAQQQTKQ